MAPVTNIRYGPRVTKMKLTTKLSICAKLVRLTNSPFKSNCHYEDYKILISWNIRGEKINKSCVLCLKRQALFLMPLSNHHEPHTTLRNKKNSHDLKYVEKKWTRLVFSVWRGRPFGFMDLKLLSSIKLYSGVSNLHKRITNVRNDTISAAS